MSNLKNKEQLKDTLIPTVALFVVTIMACLLILSSKRQPELVTETVIDKTSNIEAVAYEVSDPKWEYNYSPYLGFGLDGKITTQYEYKYSFNPTATKTEYRDEVVFKIHREITYSDGTVEKVSEVVSESTFNDTIIGSTTEKEN